MTKAGDQLADITYEALTGEMALPATRSLRRNEAACAEAAGFLVDASRRLVIVRFGSRVGLAEVAAYAEKLRENPAFRPDFSEIADLCNVEQMDLQAAEFLKLADEVDPFSVESKRAFVARNSTQAHAARMHKALRTQRNFAIFRSFEEAERWIAE